MWQQCSFGVDEAVGRHKRMCLQAAKALLQSKLELETVLHAREQRAAGAGGEVGRKAIVSFDDEPVAKAVTLKKADKDETGYGASNLSPLFAGAEKRRFRCWCTSTLQVYGGCFGDRKSWKPALLRLPYLAVHDSDDAGASARDRGLE
ncbi:unnamed protein product [Phytophthora lilii]|uniref:Unnamed protein product n=1 Tax=Phytophthora lilii TaxID=2077276 RepID=A0A9W6WRS2_9STRA|nr:unnamed protein product [Phytophthora lilii]